MGKNFFSKSIRAKLVTLFLAVTMIPITILSVVVMDGGISAVEDSVENKLEVLGNIKTNRIISFFEIRFKNLNSIAKLEKTREILTGFEKKLDSKDYKKYCEKVNPYFAKFLNSYGFQNVYLLSGKKANVLYSHNGTTAMNIEYSNNAALKELWAKVIKTGKQAMEDYSKNNVTGGHHAFIGTPIKSDNGVLKAVFVLEIDTEDISDIMHEDLGFGKSFDVFLTGEDYLMRSDSKVDDDATIFKKKVKTKSVDMALQGNRGTHRINNIDGIAVFSNYRQLGLKDHFGTDFDWVVVSELTEEKAFVEASVVRKNIILMAILIAVMVIILAFVISRYFTAPIIKMTEVAGIIAKGDLSYEFEIDQHDELGTLAKSIRTMQGNLKKQFESITEGVNVLFSSSSEIMATMSQLASGAAETATSVSETTSTVEEVKQTVDVSNQKATEVADSSHKIAQVSQDGTHSIYETIEGMSKIKQQMESIADIVIQLSEKSRTIGEIADSVGDLAEQSNLLAVNASIEAAKAGEQGRGFTVVAQEIKSLADRSKQSTVQIRKILLDIQKEISSAVMATEQGGKAIEEGLELSSKANEVITTLATNIEQASQASIQIAASSQQQLIGMDQITSAMENIKEASAQTANSTRQSEESVSELNKLGERLLDILKQYKLN